MAKRDGANPMHKILQDFVDKNKLQKGLDQVTIQTVWERVMGPAITKYTQELQFRNETLMVALNSSVLREELSYGKEKIIRNLNEEIGRELIKKIVLR